MKTRHVDTFILLVLLAGGCTDSEETWGRTPIPRRIAARAEYREWKERMEEAGALRKDSKRSVEPLRSALDLARSIDPGGILEAITLGELGSELLMESLGKPPQFEEARRGLEETRDVFRNALEIHRRVLGTERRETLWSLLWLGSTLEQLHEYAEAVPLLEEALEAARRQDDLEAAIVDLIQHRLCWNLGKMGRWVEAEEHIREYLRRSKEVEHPSVYMRSWSAGCLYRFKRDLEQAEEHFRQALDACQELKADPLCSLYRGELAGVMQRRGKVDEAIDLLEECVRKPFQDLHGAAHARLQMARMERLRGRLGPARALVIRATEDLAAMKESRIPQAAARKEIELHLRMELARIEALEGKEELALDRLRQALQDAQAMEEAAFHVPGVQVELGHLHRRLRQWEPAEEAYRQALSVYRNFDLRDDVSFFWEELVELLQGLSQVLEARGKSGEAAVMEAWAKKVMSGPLGP